MRVRKILMKVVLENGGECYEVSYSPTDLTINNVSYIANGEWKTIDMEEVMQLSEEEIRRLDSPTRTN
tara:strand:+ start:1850 stop:2053 length:204 start_codon:yes stop_codon:yes gene_type:complete